MACSCCLLAILGLIAAVLVYVKLLRKKRQLPKIEAKWFGSGPAIPDDPTIIPFKINISQTILDDLKYRLEHALPFQPPLEGVVHNYGINTELLQQIVDYWKDQYDWTKRQEFLNQFPQFQTTIQGLKVHFLHVKPPKVDETIRVLPLMLLHGWPGSVREFYEIIPILTTPQPGRNFVFEIVAPSLIGYGFSEATNKTGMNSTAMSVIFNTLMNRLGFTKYYLQGGDWGSLISCCQAILYPDNVLGLHRNFAPGGTSPHWKVLLGTLWPTLFFTEEDANQMYPLKDVFNFLMSESGYMHLQATKPDTIGVALRDSPVGLAAYIIEKFITWTNKEFKNVADGGLTTKFDYDKLLDNVMIYWVTRSITTSVRLYSEQFDKETRKAKIEGFPVLVPTAVARFKHEISFSPEVIIKETNLNLKQLTDYADGGHFAAFEVPQILAKDILDFVEKVQSGY